MKNRKSKFREQICENGLIMDGDILLRIDKNVEKDYKALQLIIAILATISTVFMGISYIKINVSLPLIFIACIALPFVFWMLHSENKSVKMISILILCMNMLILIISYSRVRNGLLLVMDKYFTLANRSSGQIRYLVDDIPSSDTGICITMFFIAFITVISFGMAFSCCFRINFPSMMLYSFPIFELGAYWGWRPYTWTFNCLIVCWFVVLALQLINYTANNAGRNNTFAISPRKKTYYFTSEKHKKGYFAIYGKFVALVCTFTFLTIIIILSITGFQRPENYSQMRSDLSEFISDFSYNKLANSIYDWQDNFLGTKAVGSASGGVLGDVDGISFNNTTSLELQIDKFNYPLYLKGFVAGHYENNSWTPVEVNGELNAFKDIGLNVQDINYRKLSRLSKSDLLVNEMVSSLSPSQFAIKVVGASRKYAYAPYMTSYDSDTSMGDDKSVPTEEGFVQLRDTNYVMNYYNLSSFGTSWTAIANTLSSISTMDSEYLNSINTTEEQLYRQFVFDNYLEFEGSDALDDAVNTINDSYISAYYGNSSTGYSTDFEYYSNVINGITKYFDDNFQYTLEPGKTPKGEDFIDYFLTEQKKGYCSYFASAGTMLLRQFGIPARYVEGYIVLPSQLGSDNGAGIYNIEVKDKSAHAWTEIYIDEIGWIPIEFTPGYENDNPNINTTSNPNSSTNSSESSSSSATTTTTTMTTTSVDDESSEPDESSSQTTTTTKEQGNNSSGDNSADSDITGNSGLGNINGKNDSAEDNSGYTELILYVALGLIVISAIALRRMINIKKQEKRINSGTTNIRIKNLYTATLKYLSLSGIDIKDNITDMQEVEVICKKMAEKNFSADSISGFKTLSDMAIHAHFSKKLMNNESLSPCISAYKNIKAQVYGKLNSFGKISAFLIYNLY